VLKHRFGISRSSAGKRPKRPTAPSADDQPTDRELKHAALRRLIFEPGFDRRARYLQRVSSNAQPYERERHTMTTRRHGVEAALDEGKTCAEIAFRFLEAHSRVLTRLGVWHDTLNASDDETTSRCELVDGFGNVIAAVTLRVDDNGAITLVGQCNRSAAVHTCPNRCTTTELKP